MNKSKTGKRILWTLIAVVVLIAFAFGVQQVTNQPSIVEASFKWNDGTTTMKPWHVTFGSDEAIDGVVAFDQYLYFVTKTGDLEAAGIQVKNELAVTPGKPWTVVWGSDRELSGVITMDGVVYLTSKTDVQNTAHCGCTPTCEQVVVEITTPTPTSTYVPSVTNTPGGPTATSTPGNPTITSTPGSPTSTVVVPTATPVVVVPTEKPKANCGVGNGVDGDTKGCDDWKNDGTGSGPGNPGHRGGKK